MEQFEGLSHEEICAKVEEMAPGLMHAVADVYDAAAIALSGGLFGAHLAIQRELSDGMGGQFADAADQAARKFYDQATDVQEVIRSVAFRIKAAAYGAEVVKKSVPPVPVQIGSADPAISTTVVDPAQIAQTVVGATDPAAAAALDRFKEEQRLVAVEAMNLSYKPTYQPAGDGVPTFVPVQAPGDGTDSPVPGGTSTAGPDGSSDTTSSNPSGDTSGAETPGENETPGEDTETTGSEEDSQTTSAGTDDSPTTQQPSSTTTGAPVGDPQRTTPSTTTTGSPSGFPAGMPGGAPQNQTPGKTVPGAPGSPGAPTAGSAVASTAAGATRGMSGMPGMMAPGAGKRGGEDDGEHKTPDYLIQDREEELFGPRAVVLGGVLGADAPAAQPADDRGDRR